MVWFKPKPIVDQDEFEWLLACFAWLDRELGEQDRAQGYTPVLARLDTPGIAEASGATDLFAAIKQLAGLEAWDCALAQLDEGPRVPASEGLIAEDFGRRALGTFSVEQPQGAARFGVFGQPVNGPGSSSGGTGARPVIRYHPELLRDPEALAATFAHELAHLVGTTLGDPPGGGDLHEHATDCTAVYMGFGVFLANRARQFSQFSDGLIQGWQSSTSGYLSERALVTLLAMFVRLFGHDADAAAQGLKPYLRSDLAKALKYQDWRFPQFADALGAVDLEDWA